MTSMTDLIVLVDLDGTANEIQEHFLAYVEKIGYKFNYDFCEYYDLEKGIVADRKTQQQIHNTIFTDDYFWKTIPVSANATEGLKYLNDTCTLFIATQPFDEHNKSIKLEWLDKYFPFISSKQVIFSDTKWKLNGHVIIEDKPHTLEKCLEYDWKTIKRVQPYNLKVDATCDLHNWNEIENVMNSMIKE